ncbi:uncharacterized protein LOC124460835 [Drosophila willistoni]|uniref:uncharacterized protein LOC124460835 n=1 Tax=Drosophila willistoni TaxID=7260 RepID=UPI001F0780DE|nr:uncharacterized protein LOC124460835 [Drosophila willistoni]
MVPLRQATSAALKKAFRERIANPPTLVSDNGTQFTRKVFKNFCKTSAITLQHTAPYSPQQNPTERANRTIKTMIAQYLVNDTTGFSAAYIILGREPRMPGALYDQVTDVSGNEPPSPDERFRRMEDIFKLVHENQLNATQNQKKYCDLRRRDWRPSIGSMVMLKQHVLSNANEGFNAKLAPSFQQCR